MLGEFTRRLDTDILTAAQVYTRVNLGKHFCNYGAAGAVAVTLPADAAKGDIFHASVATAQSLAVGAGAAARFSLAGTLGVAGHTVVSSTPGDTMSFVCIGLNTWLCRGGTGGWAAV